MIPWRPIIAGSTGSIFTEFSPNGRQMIVKLQFIHCVISHASKTAKIIKR